MCDHISPHLKWCVLFLFCVSIFFIFVRESEWARDREKGMIIYYWPNQYWIHGIRKCVNQIQSICIYTNTLIFVWWCKSTESERTNVKLPTHWIYRCVRKNESKREKNEHNIKKGNKRNKLGRCRFLSYFLTIISSIVCSVCTIVILLLIISSLRLYY